MSVDFFTLYYKNVMIRCDEAKRDIMLMIFYCIDFYNKTEGGKYYEEDYGKG